MAYDRYDNRDGRRDEGRDYRSGGNDDRGFFERARDEVQSWFGDEEAEQRRMHDERMGHPGSDRYSRDRDDRGDRRGRDGDRWREARDERRWKERRAEQRREWRRGARLAPEYRTRHYVVDDWRGHRLRQPPRGYHWVQQGSDYLLVAVATGVIADLILNH